MVNNLPANVGDIRDAGLIPRLRRSPGGGQSNPLQYFCLENPIDRGAWWATVHRVAKSWTRLKRLSTHTCSLALELAKEREMVSGDCRLPGRRGWWVGSLSELHSRKATPFPSWHRIQIQKLKSHSLGQFYTWRRKQYMCIYLVLAERLERVISVVQTEKLSE